MTNEIIFWAKTASDSRHTASAVGFVKIPANLNAVALARAIDSGDTRKAAQVALESNRLENAAAGHGVTIKYANGRLRHVRWEA